MKAESVEPDLEGTHVQGSMRPARVLVCGGLREQRSRAVAAGLCEDLLGQLEHEVCRRFRGLVGKRGVGPLALESCPLDAGQSRSYHVCHLIERRRTEKKTQV